MPLLLIRQCFALWLALASACVFANSLDDDLRLAAKLHRGGDTSQAVAIWEARAASGNIESAYNLAVIHHYADGVPLDYAAAMKWYRLAADKGDKVAQFQIGLMYQNGEGVVADQAEAHRWFTLHLQHHLHHQHSPQMVAWRQQALALIEERDRREQVAASRANSARILADLRYRAGITGERPMETAALDSGTTRR